MATFRTTKGAPPKPPTTETKGAPPEKASRTLASSDDNEQADISNVNFKLSPEQAQQFRVYCKLIGKTQLEVFGEAIQMHKKAHADILKAAMETL